MVEFEQINPKRWLHARDLVMDRVHFPMIPASLVRHLEMCQEHELSIRAVRRILEDPEAVTAGINRMFKLASLATRLDSEELLRRADFRWQDVGLHRLKSAFAEMRAINFLREQAFRAIKPLRAKAEKFADVYAERGDYRYAAEVVLSIYEAPRRFSAEQLAKWLIGRLRKGKLSQLEGTAHEFSAEKKIVIAIVDSALAVALQSHADFHEAARIAWAALGRYEDVHVCFVTGSTKLGYGSDDAVFPPW